jgi:hypothetical protein
LQTSTFSKKEFFVLWLINPFVSAWMLLRNMKGVSGMGPYLLLSFFFGFSFVIAPNSVADSTRYVQELKQLYVSEVSFDTYLSQIYSEESSKLDIYQPLLTWIVGQFTGNYQWLFGIYAIVFGFFWFKAILMARSLLPDRLSIFFVFLMLLFALINPIWSINGVRMWTAVGMFFYGLLLLHFINNKKGYVFIVLPLFVHFSLTIALVLYVAYRLLPTKNFSLLYGVYVLTFFIGELDLGVIKAYFELLPGFVQSRQGYLNEEYAEGVKVATEQYAAHIKLYRNLLKYVIISMVSWMYFSMFFKKAKSISKFAQFFAMALIFSAFTNLASQIPSGGRFAVLSNLLVVFSFIWYLSKEVNGYIPKSFQSISKLILLFIVIVQIRMGADYFGAFLFIGNLVVNLFIQDNTPFIDFVKAIF